MTFNDYNATSLMDECIVYSLWIAPQNILKERVQRLDWAMLKIEQRKFFMKLAGLPCTTIFATSDITPAEKQNLTSIIPNFGQGSFGRELVEMIGNVFYSNFEEGKYVVYINADNRKVLTKQKFKKIKDDKVLAEKLDITGDPSKLWKYIDDIRAIDDKKIVEAK
ncbi:MAG: hypothetical protein ACRCZ9_09105 [Fusobacteriaceae bacterium]